MADDSFEALWFLYQVARRSLKDMAGRTKRKSHLTYFYEAITVACNRSNSVDDFLRFLERAIELNFTVDYGYPLPSQADFAALFKNLKRHGMLSYMPQLNDRVRQQPELPEGEEE